MRSGFSIRQPGRKSSSCGSCTGTTSSQVYKLYKNTLTTSVVSGAPLPSGHWSAVLKIDRRKDTLTTSVSSGAPLPSGALERRPQGRRTSREEDGRHRSLTRTLTAAMTDRDFVMETAELNAPRS